MRKIDVDINGGFEKTVVVGDETRAWWRKTHTGQEFGNVFVPLQWTAFWRDGGLPDWDPGNQHGFVKPEMKVIPRVAPFLDPPRVYHGQYATQWFSFNAIHEGGIYQQIETRKDDLINFSIFAHAWTTTDSDSKYVSRTSGDAHNQMRFWLGIDPLGNTDPWGNSVAWTGPFLAYDRFKELQAQEVALSDRATLYIRSLVKYPFKHNDVYVDSAAAHLVRGVESGTKPRDEWKIKRGLIIPGHVPDGQGGRRQITLEEWQRAGRWAYAHDMMDWGQSFDSFMYGPGLDSVGVYIGQIVKDAIDMEEVRNFRDTYYPEAEILGEIDLSSDDVEPPEPPEPPDPPSDGEVPPEHRQPQHTSNLYFGPHFRGFVDDKEEMIEQAKSVNPPMVMKAIVGGELAEMSYHLRPEHKGSVLRVLRRHVANDSRWVLADNKRESAVAFLDLNTQVIDDTVSGLSRDRPELGVRNHDDLFSLYGGLVLDSVNEVAGTHDALTPHWVEFEIEYMQAIERRYGDKVRAGILRYPIGNPGMDELDRLLPAVRYAAEATPKHYIGAHQAYWGSRKIGEQFSYTVSPYERVHPQLQNGGWYWMFGEDGEWKHLKGTAPDPATLGPVTRTYTNGLELHGPWLAYRWMVWDDYYRNLGLYPLYFAGEGGPMGVHGDCGPGTLGGHGGWRDACGEDDFDAYIMPQIKHANQKYLEWNRTFGWRYYGTAWFTNHWWGWDSFWVLGRQIRTLTRWANGL